MRKALTFILIILFQFAKGQTISSRVIDSSNNRPLSYAIITYDHEQKVVYTDVEGYFIIPRDSLKQGDFVTIKYVGYIQKKLPAFSVYDGLVIKLEPQVPNLQPIIVTNCRNLQEYTLNKKTGRIKQYIGPGPETRLIIMARYYNVIGRNSYIKKISVLIDEKSPNLKIPVRLRWYAWDNDNDMPGKELTDTNIVVYPYKEGWNDFDIPPNTIPCPKDWIVFGFEFIYPPEYQVQYDALTTEKEKLKWLNDMKHRWSLGLQYVYNPNETGFYIVNNGEIYRYNKKYERYFLRPAAKFTIAYCGD